MPSITQFPFPSGTAPEPQVVEWLAEVLYPKEYRKGGYDRSKAKNRVRCRISYARDVTKDHRLRRLKDGHINVSQFYSPQYSGHNRDGTDDFTDGPLSDDWDGADWEKYMSGPDDDYYE